MEPLDLLGREDRLALLETLVRMGLKVHRAIKVTLVPLGLLVQLVTLEPEEIQDHKALLGRRVTRELQDLQGLLGLLGQVDHLGILVQQVLQET